MSQRTAMFLTGLLLAAAPAAPAAATEEYTFKPFLVATYVSPMDSTQARVGNQIAKMELSDEAGWEAGFEWRFSHLFGVEAAYGHSEHQIDFGGQKLGDASYEPIYVGLDFHFFERGNVDLYMAPTVVFANWSESDLRRGVEKGDDSDTGFGATFGFDCMMGDTWALTGGLRYVDVQIGIGSRGEVAVDPLVFRFGVAAKF